MNAIELLKADHKKVKKLLEELAETTTQATKKRTELLEKIKTEITVHTKIEEEIFYPAFLQAAETKQDEKLYYEAWEEHRAAKRVLDDLERAEVDTPVFGGRAKVLKELVTHHAEEEEDDLFPKARKLMSKEELEELGERLEQRKKQLMARGNGKSAEARA